MTSLRVAGLLLTGGASRRLGQDKALLPAPGGRTLAEHLGSLLEEVVELALEVGPGHSGLPAVRESPPGAGPLAAVAAGWHFLQPTGAEAALVLAVDQPYVTVELLRLLADRAEPGSVVPLDPDGRAQPLCARFVATVLDGAAALVAAGEQSMQPLLVTAATIGIDEWGDAASGNPFADLDTPDDLAAYIESLDADV